MRKRIQSEPRCRGQIEYADNVFRIPSEECKMVQETLFSCDGFIGAQQLYCIQTDTTATT